MLEMGRAVAQPDLGRHADAREEIAFEFGDVDRRLVGARVQLQVEHRAGGVFDGRETLVEIARGEQLVDQRLGQWLAGLVVTGVSAQHLRRLNPMLQDLRRELDKICLLYTSPSPRDRQKS